MNIRKERERERERNRYLESSEGYHVTEGGRGHEGCECIGWGVSLWRSERERQTDRLIKKYKEDKKQTSSGQAREGIKLVLYAHY